MKEEKKEEMSDGGRRVRYGQKEDTEREGMREEGVTRRERDKKVCSTYEEDEGCIGREEGRRSQLVGKKREVRGIRDAVDGIR